MVDYLSDEWFAEYQRMGENLPEAGGATITMQYVVSGGTDGDVRYYVILEEGRITKVERGNADKADVTLSMKHENAVKLQQGQLNPSTAVMTGKVKSRGNMKMLMGLLPVLNSPGYQQFERRLCEVTDF